MGGGSNAIGLFHPFLDDTSVQMIGVEAAGHGLDKDHAASLPAASGHPAWQQDLSAAGRGRPDHRRAFDQRGSGLSRHRPRTFLAPGSAA
jgi:hypothetical protein